MAREPIIVWNIFLAPISLSSTPRLEKGGNVSAVRNVAISKRVKRDMSNRETVLRAVYAAVDELNKQLPNGVVLNKSPEAALYGKSSKLESIDLVTFIMEVEEKIQEEFGLSIMIADEFAMSQNSSPFLTLGTFTEYMMKLLEANGISPDE